MYNGVRPTLAAAACPRCKVVAGEHVRALATSQAAWRRKKDARVPGGYVGRTSVLQSGQSHDRHGGTAKDAQRRGFFGGNMGGGGGPPRGDSEKFYNLLGISKDASESDIKKAYKTQAMKHHPDRGGDEKIFKEISRAYEVLSDSEKRQVYDAYGEEALDQMGSGGPGGPGGAHPGGMDPFDLFSSMFGQARRSARGRPLTQDSVYELQLTLEDMYLGTKREIAFNREKICGTCDGLGAHDVKKCSRCGGSGFTVHMQQVGPIVQQVQVHCSACGAKGYTAPPQNICKTCRGRGSTKQRTTFDIDIKPGAADGQEFRFQGQADEKLNHDPGDVVVMLREKEHATFQRVHDMLMMTKKVSLAEALCGFQFNVKFLDGEDIVVRSREGNVLQPGDFVVVKGKGMPRPQGKQHGDLLVRIQVDFPTTIDKEAKGKLLDALGGEAVPEEPPLGHLEAAKLTARQTQELARNLQDAERQRRRQQQSSQQGECQQM
eukprot:TRINITY_DN13112_c0_g2_i1.p1 TRINITY_DN13112_c0_g2~~TRINITY_DN13112_c0_g2_i1.p1  ORF type:complete len:490 (+),score=114.90 TRINITY_DN13112_c0_g2_i1:82-1551(+)